MLFSLQNTLFFVFLPKLKNLIMAIYWFIWTFIIGMSLSKEEKMARLTAKFFLGFLVFFIGWRWGVGGDWGNYLNIFEFFKVDSFSEVWFISDIGYSFLNWASFKMGFDIAFINLICAFFFVFGFGKFILSFKNHWIAIIPAFSYTLTAVAMGYTRQSVAIGFVFAAFASLLNKNKKLPFILWILAACLFHKSAVVLFMFVPLINSNFLKSFWFFLYCIGVFIVCFGVFYFISLEDNMYTTGEVVSTGAVRRLGIHLFPVSIYWLYKKHFKKALPHLIKILDLMSILIIFSFFASFSFSTLVDRLNLYLIVYDIIILGYFSTILSQRSKILLILLLFLMHTAIFYIWANYSVWAICCFQYNNLIFELISK